VCMYVADGIRVVLFSAIYPKTPIAFISIWMGEEYDREVLFNAWLVYFWCTAVYALGSILFVKRSILKTTLTLFILFWITAFVVLGLVMVSSGNYNNIFESVLVAYGWLSIPFLWWLSYNCFKEMEVVDTFSFNGSKAWVVGYFAVSILLIGICATFDKAALDAVEPDSVDETAIFLERTVEKPITPIAVVQFEDSSSTDLAEEYNLTLAVEVNYVSDASKCSVIYPEQVIQVRQQGDTLYYTYNPELYKRDKADLNFVNGPDGMADASTASDEGNITYQIKGADGKIRTAIDKHYNDGNKVRIVINTLPGNLAVRQTSRQSTLIGAGKTKGVSVEGGFSLELDSLSHIDALSVVGMRVFKVGTAQVNRLVVTLRKNEDDEGEMETRFNTDYPAVINHVVVKGAGKLSGLSKMACKRIELLPDSVGSISLEMRDVTRRMVLE
ncbi:MAG: ABC transporter permease, partial [Prevotella sp.]